MAYDESSAEAQVGKRAEAAVDKWVKRRGWYVMRVADISGGAAMLEGLDDKLIALDRLIVRDSSAKWVDVKWKSGAILYQKMNVLRHGIDRPNWNDYLRMQQISGLQGALAVVQVKVNREWPPETIAPRLLWGTLDHLQRNEADGNSNESMVYWDVGVFEDLGPIDIGNGSIPQTQLNLHPWERACGKLRAPNVLPPQLELFPRGEAG